jgi:MoaA/NifB/PqqE/SkfB family radical SAM enzyme
MMLPEKLKSLIKRFIHTKEPFCNAPFGSLYFTQNGNVTACCQNRMYLLGIYPENSVEEIWQGDRIKILRNCLLKKDISRGCFGCTPSGIVNYSLKKNEYAFINKKNKHPEYFVFQLSNQCNLNCIMCNYENSVNHITVNPSHKIKNYYDENFVDQIEKYLPYLKRTFFLGGEPFLIDVIYEIWERIIKINNKIIITVLSNGTIYNDRIEDLLKRGNFEISLSVDSFTKENYENIRRNADFNKMMENVSFYSDYMKAKGQKLIIDVCLMKENLEEIPTIFEYCSSRHFPVFINNVIWPKKCSLMFMDSAELKNACEHLTHYQNKVNWNNEPENKRLYDRIISQVDGWWRGALDYEKSELYKTNDIETLKNLLISGIRIFIAKQMGYLNQSETDAVIDNLKNYIELLKPFLTSEDEMISILKNLQRIPLNEIITECMVSEKNTVIDRFLMFR